MIISSPSWAHHSKIWQEWRLGGGGRAGGQQHPSFKSPANSIFYLDLVYFAETQFFLGLVWTMVLAQLATGLNMSGEGRRLDSVSPWRKWGAVRSNWGALRSNWAGAGGKGRAGAKGRSWMTCKRDSTVILFVVHISLLLHYPTDMVFVTAN